MSLIAQDSSHYDMGSLEAYTLHRIFHGVPEGQVDIPPTHAFPMESNLDVMGACKWFQSINLPISHPFSGFQERLLCWPRINSPNFSYWRHS